MSSCENGVSRWNLKHARGAEELQEPVDSFGDDTRFAPEKPLGGINQCLHISGKADSAYSSFSGGSNLPEYTIPICYSEPDSLRLQQLPYMDTGYLRGIYNPCAIKEEFKLMYEDKGAGKSTHYALENTGHSRIHGSSPNPGVFCQTPSPLGRFLSPLPCPSSQGQSEEVNTNIDQTPGICQADVCIREPSKELPFDATTNCYNDYCPSRCDNETSVTEEDAGCLTKSYTAKKNNSSIFIKPFAFSQEKITPVSSQKTLQAQNAIHAYKIPERMNSDSFPLQQTSHSAVNDTQKNKQGLYACSVHKPPGTERDLPSSVAVSSQAEGLLYSTLRPFSIPDRSKLEQVIYVSATHSNFINSSLPNKPGLEIISDNEEKKGFISLKEGKIRSSWQPLLKQQTTMQKPHAHGLDFTETSHLVIYEPTNTISCYNHDAEDTVSQQFNGSSKLKENNYYHNPELLVNPRQEEMLNTVSFPKQQFLNKAEIKPQDDFANEKINRKTTPLLYYLSGGRNLNIMSHKVHNALEQEGTSVRSPRSHCSLSAVPAEIPGDNHHHVEDIASLDEGLCLESCASSLDEKFKNDYRDKLKIAQRKVLRETSFKRKDLQMSLPIRLKQKASSRPSIQHLRSLSLSSSNEESRSIPPFKSLGNLSKEEETKRPQTVRIMGRKMATTEQKKISYSEPEKLNHLEDQRDQSELWKKKNVRSHSDELNEEDTRILRHKALESQGRDFTKAKLKQIQQNALFEYMERKTGQRPAAASNSVQQRKPPLQGRTSNPKRFSEEGASNPSTSRKLQGMDGLWQLSEPPPFHLALTSREATPDGCNASSLVPEKAKTKLHPATTEGSWASNCRLHSVSSAIGKVHGGSRSTPSPVQDFCIPTICLPLPAEDHGCSLIRSNSPSKENLEADQKNALTTVKQSTYVTRRRKKSVEETGSLETIRLSPLSQSTVQFHRLKSWLVSSGAETGQSNQEGGLQQHLNDWESPGRHLPRQSPTEDSTSHAFGQPLSTKNNKEKLPSISDRPWSPSVSQAPLLPGGSFPCSKVLGEPRNFSPVFSLTEVDEEVFKDSSSSDSEMNSNLPSFPKQSACFTADMETLTPASTAPISQIYIKGKQNEKEQNKSFTVPEKDESILGGNKEDENSVGNSHCPEIAFFLQEKSNTNSQLKNEMSEKSPVYSASPKEHLEANNRTHQPEEGTDPRTTLVDSQGSKAAQSLLANSKAMQTDKDCDFPVQTTDSSIAHSKSPEDQRCEDLAVEIIAKDKSLVDILTPHPIRKTTLELMEGLFPVNFLRSGRSYRWKGRIQSVQENDQRSIDHATDPSHEASTYLEQGAEDVTFHVNQMLSKNGETLDDPENIISKKRELISSLQLKLQALWDESELIQSEAKVHAEHGKKLESRVREICKPNEYERYMMFIGDLEKVVSLLLCLSSRLARVQNAMEKIDENMDVEEEQSLKERHRLLSRQREDAKDLKENLDRRERVVLDILSKYMTENQLQDYRHYVQEKTSFLIEQKDLDEQIMFLQEQLERLQKSIAP